MVAVRETKLEGIPLKGRGKVRDIYELEDSLLIVATDRISAYDVVMREAIPDKGRILNHLCAFWFAETEDIIQNHLISADITHFPDACRPYADLLRDRTMWVKRARPLPVECIVRGYLAGSGWKEYLETGQVCGYDLPRGLLESAKLPEPLFTPSTKAEAGAHDENISFADMVGLIGEDLANHAREVSLALYRRGLDVTEPKGMIIADTKFEFGLLDGELILIDEILTPDSSRFWPGDQYQPGGPQVSFDKQFLRDFLSHLDWDRNPPPPPLPDDIVQRTRDKYIEALVRLTGRRLG